MGAFVKGDVVVVPFPFSKGSGEKRRPALVLACWSRDDTTDYLLCLISAQHASDPYIIELDPTDVLDGRLDRTSYLRPTYLFTVAESRILRKIGVLSGDLLRATVTAIKSVL